jgi:hypothetical protein
VRPQERVDPLHLGEHQCAPFRGRERDYPTVDDLVHALPTAHPHDRFGGRGGHSLRDAVAHDARALPGPGRGLLHRRRDLAGGNAAPEHARVGDGHPERLAHGAQTEGEAARARVAHEQHPLREIGRHAREAPARNDRVGLRP